MIAERIHSHQSNDSPVGFQRHIVWTSIALLSLLVLAPSLRAQEKTAAETAGPPKRVNVAVLGLENKTGDSELAHWRCATMLLSGSLKEVKAIRVLSDDAARYALRQVGLRAGDPIDPNRARLMGGHIEAQRVVWGSYSKQDNQWHVEIRVINVATGAVSAVLGATASDWFDIRDKLDEQILTELGMVPSAEEEKKMAERWTRSAEALDWSLKVQLSQDQGKPVTDLEMLSRKALAADPNCASAYCDLAATLATQGKFNLAEDAAHQALRLKPDSMQAHAVLGWVALNQNQFDRAETQFRQACQLDPDSTDCSMYLAAACVNLGKWEEAVALFEKAVSLDRTNAMAHGCLAHVWASRKRQDDALRELAEVRRYLPEGTHALDALSKIADTYAALGRPSEALEYNERILPLARELAVNPDTIRVIEKRIQYLKSTLTPTFIQASMPKRYTPEELDEILRDKLTDGERSFAANPFACTDSMRQWAKDLTRGMDKDLAKAKAIFDELAARFDTEGPLKSRTAREVFDAWKDPKVPLVCLDRAVLFVALARVVDVNACFVYVGKLPGGTVMSHACAAVFTGDRTLLVDPAFRWFGAPHRQYTILDDVETTAFLCFCNREGDPQEVAAYRAGLRLRPDSVLGRMSLVAGLIRASQLQEARRLFAEIPQPPSEDYEAAMYWSLAGEPAIAEQNWDRAKECLLKSISIWPGQSYAYFSLGRVYMQQHQLADARTAFRACLRNGPSERTAGIARAAIAQINEQIGVDSGSGSTAPEKARSPLQ
jgi:tetratricopeptide (TPR) repeat protein